MTVTIIVVFSGPVYGVTYAAFGVPAWRNGSQVTVSPGHGFTIRLSWYTHVTSWYAHTTAVTLTTSVKMSYDTIRWWVFNVQ